MTDGTVGGGEKVAMPDGHGELEIVHRTALKYLPGVDGIPSGDPLRITAAAQASFL